MIHGKRGDKKDDWGKKKLEVSGTGKYEVGGNYSIDKKIEDIWGEK